MRPFAVFPIAVILAGCASQVPIPSAHPISYQKKAMAAHHWDVLADDVSGQTAAALSGDSPLKQHPLYVAPARENTTFNRAFRDLLITRLVNRGFDVRTTKAGGLEVSYETQLVQHRSERQAYQPGTLTALAVGLLVARNVAVNMTGDGQIAAGLGLVAAGDFGSSLAAGHPATKTELIVTTSISRDGRYLMRKSDIYYLEDADRPLFVEERSAPPTAVRNWKVVGDQ